MKPSDKWRDYFRRGDSDIFGIINHAIILAAADFPNELKSRRDGIAQLLYSCNVSRRSCIECGHDGGDEKKLNDDDIVDEVMRIKDILLNKDDESNGVLLHSLRKLESMSLNVDLLKDTEIVKAVNGLRSHGSDKIRELAKALCAEWKELVDQWVNSMNEIIGDEGTPESAIYSVVDEGEAFPSPPHDLDFLASEPNGFELSQILDGLDCDGNPRHTVDPKRKSSTMRSPKGTHVDKNQQTRKEEVDVRHLNHSATVFDDPRRQPMQTREQMVQRKSTVVSEQKRNSQQEKLKALDPDAKFEFAKRKLQESYQQHDKAKRQRTIQVLETIPKQSKAKKPLPKRPVRR